MKILIKILLRSILVFVLTILTQVGGLIFLISMLNFRTFDKIFENKINSLILKTFSFLALYFLSIFVIIPLIAKPFGRVPLPMLETNHVQPANIITVLLMRNYIRPQLRDATYEVAQKMHNKYPGTTLNYLDANFPFFDEFPLLPHLSHNDGKKLDVSFHYIDAATNNQSNEVPSWLGYGVCEEPQLGEFDRPSECSKKGYWQYSYLKKVVSQKNKNKYPFDKKRTKDQIEFFAAQKEIAKILIEPHLKQRLNLTSGKIRLHGCNAVRHDDHLHVEVR